MTPHLLRSESKGIAFDQNKIMLVSNLPVSTSFLFVIYTISRFYFLRHNIFLHVRPVSVRRSSCPLLF
ncbi:uncharacterized protein BO88DRAFT_223796 [Aspergillus vadensis CBS 113365]|uniref:Uncharacterized protein n=1 Tax=Aspergillus vadensis (strain CBS 113365 / IMI 142717 / IBT 24658) TaxID=1448311 RepID=A0A319AU89_ASPVC|nr:hypothetical protein BO88DRAFT_223796 [Aspergillus vadensis CBS 113365]PYH63235.1 hypothetical protein BO88DRAFT_223796 [Aspergillus vadensis CBS 113365]